MSSSNSTAGVDVQGLVNRAILRPQELSALPAAELDMSLRLLRRARLLGFVASRLQADDALDELPDVVRDQFLGGLAMANARARLARWELDRIAWALSERRSSRLLLMKGCAYLALDLPNTPGRLFADVDLMTAEDTIEQVEAGLNERGWVSQALTPYDQNYYRRWTHELPPLIHEDREVEIDLHHNIVPRTARIKPEGRELLARARPLPDSPYEVLAPEDMVLHAMVHLMFDADLADKLRDLLDISLLLEHFAAADPAFWTTLADRAQVLGLTRPAFYSLRYVNRLLGTDIPQDAMQQAAAWGPPRAVLRLMDALVPEALYPLHPDRPSRGAGVARLLLYVRSHWLRMPPWLLAYHLSYKFVATRLRRRPA